MDQVKRFLLFFGALIAWPPCVQALVLGDVSTPVWAGGSVAIVSGTQLADAKMMWDGKPLESSFVPDTKRRIFTIPRGTPEGPHTLSATDSSDGISSRVVYVVQKAMSSRPRLDHVMLVNTSFSSGGLVQTTLYVQGANLDVSSRVLINGSEVPSAAHRLLYNDMFGAKPDVLRLPIWHYLSKTVKLDPMRAGSTVNIQIVNEDGQVTDQFAYNLPESAQSLDSDGDGIPDVIEREGYDVFIDGDKVHVDLAGLGADPFVRDVFVELDVMEGVTYPPKAEALRLASATFSNAPILNPFKPRGIHLYIDSSGTVPNWDLLGFRPSHDNVARIGSFDIIMNEYFTPSRRGYFHYAVWAKAHELQWSGESNVDFNGTGVGDGFIVTLSDFPMEYQTPIVQASTLLHELGHNLGQRHGGSDHYRYKATYWSVMSYTWQLRSGWPKESRTQFPTCVQLFYGRDGAAEVQGAIPVGAQQRIDYSDGMGPELNANNGGLREADGVCGQAIDWDRDGAISASPVNAQLNPESPTATSIDDYPNWARLSFLGPKLGGRRIRP